VYIGEEQFLTADLLVDKRAKRIYEMLKKEFE